MSLTHSDVYALGYPRVIPISPATKIPGELRNGAWGGLKGWSKDTYDETRRKAWTAMGASVGLLPGDHVMGFDADTLDPALAEIIREEIERIAPNCPVRVGRAPKALYLVRLSSPLRLKDLKFGDQREALEFRTGLRQVVLAGQHEKTGKPYFWTRSLVPFDQLPIVTPEQVLAMAARLAERLPDAEKPKLAGSGEDKGQRALRGDPERVAKTVTAMRNGPSLGWNDFVEMVCALRGAMPDDLNRAEGLFLDWCDRWEGGTADLDTSRKAWDSIRPPVRIGANWLYEKAAEWSGGTRNIAHGPFDDLGDEIPSLFTAPENTSRDTFPLLTISDIENRPPLEWLVKRHIPRVSMGFLYSVPGAGKSFLALDMALTIASGAATWFGDAIGADNRTVVYIAAEGAYGFGDRIAAWKKMHGDAETAKNVGRNFLMLPATIAFMDRNDVEKLLRTVRELGTERRPCLVVVDTVSRMLPGADENLQKDMTLFIDACGAVREAFQCAVVGVHHAGKSGDMRGSTVLQGAGDFVFKLERNKKARVGTLHAEKQKDGADGWSDAYSFAPVVLGPERSSLVVARTAVSITDALDDDGAPTARAADVLAAIGRAWSAGVPWSKGHQGKERYAVNHLIKMGFVRGDAEILLAKMLDDGLIEVATCGAKKHLEGYRVVENGQNVSEIDLFG